MAKDKPSETKIRSTNASAVSIEMIRAWERIMIAWVKAGEANFLQGYSSNIVLTDFAYRSGFISKQAYDDNRLQTQIFAGITDFNALASTIFGSGGILQPQMKSRVEQNNDSRRGKGDEDEDDDFGAAISQLATQALAGAIEAAAVLA